MLTLTGRLCCGPWQSGRKRCPSSSPGPDPALGLGPGRHGHSSGACLSSDRQCSASDRGRDSDSAGCSCVGTAPGSRSPGSRLGSGRSFGLGSHLWCPWCCLDRLHDSWRGSCACSRSACRPPLGGGTAAPSGSCSGLRSLRIGLACRSRHGLSSRRVLRPVHLLCLDGDRAHGL